MEQAKKIDDMHFYNLVILGEYLLVDIREEKLYEQGHIDGALNLNPDLPFTSFLKILRNNPPERKSIILVYGEVENYGTPSQEKACSELSKLPSTDKLYILETGYTQFKDLYPYLNQTTLPEGSQALYPPQILPHVFIGSVYFARDKSILKALNIKYILNVAQECNNHFESDAELGIQYLKIGMVDNVSPNNNITVYFNDCFAFLEKARNENARAFVHCVQGVSRSATVAIAYLIKHYGWSFSKALSHVQEMRPVVRPNEHFLRLLRLYSESVHEIV